MWPTRRARLHCAGVTRIFGGGGRCGCDRLASMAIVAVRFDRARGAIQQLKPVREDHQRRKRMKSVKTLIFGAALLASTSVMSFAALAKDIVVGVSWSTFQQER